MADTIRLLAALQALFPDNTTGEISPQDLRDFLVSAMPTGRAATKVVASSTASDLQKAQADYVCDGVADDVEIQAAINALPAAGGSVFLTDGTFYLTATLSRAINGVTLMGQGLATRLQNNGVTALINVTAVADWLLLWFTVDAGGIAGFDSDADGNWAVVFYDDGGAGVPQLMSTLAMKLVNKSDFTQKVVLRCDAADRLYIRSKINLFDHVQLRSPPNFLDITSLDETSFLLMRALAFFIVNTANPADGSDSARLTNTGGVVIFRNYGDSAHVPARAQQVQVEDGINAPGTIAGVAQLYVDVADGDLKVKFGDGTVKTIATDT